MKPKEGGRTKMESSSVVIIDFPGAGQEGKVQTNGMIGFGNTQHLYYEYTVGLWIVIIRRMIHYIILRLMVL